MDLVSFKLDISGRSIKCDLTKGVEDFLHQLSAAVELLTGIGYATNRSMLLPIGSLTICVAVVRLAHPAILIKAFRAATAALGG